MVFVLAVLKILHKPLGWVLLILVTVLGARDLKLAGGEAWCSITQQIGKARFSATWLGHAFILLFLFVVLGVVLISALGPAIEFDGLSYHLTGPKIYVQESERSIGRMRSSFIEFHLNLWYRRSWEEAKIRIAPKPPDKANAAYRANVARSVSTR